MIIKLNYKLRFIGLVCSISRVVVTWREREKKRRRKQAKILISLLHAHRLITTRAHNARKEKHENEVTLFEQIIINGELYSFPHALLIIISSSKLHAGKPSTDNDHKAID